MTKKEDIKKLVLSTLTENEFFVDIGISKSNQINVYIDGYDDFGIDQCKRISKVIESGLDRDNEDFELTVSTPGLDRNFKCLEQYLKYKGEKIDIVLDDNNKYIAVIEDVDKEKQEISIHYKINKKEKKETLQINEIINAKPHINF